MRTNVASRQSAHSQSPIRYVQRLHNQSPHRLSAANHLRPIYFCHYRNAMYMGGVRMNDKHGYGIVLHDNGCSALTTYENDILHGHSVILTQEGNVLSAEFSRNKCLEAAFKTDSHVLFIRPKDGLVEGDAVLVNYPTRQIEHVRFNKGSVISKIFEKDQIVKSRVFDNRELDLLIPKRHAKALQLQVQFGLDIRMNKQGNKTIVGFCRGNQLEGLGFKVIEKIISSQLDVLGQGMQTSQFVLSQRGLYNSSKLDGLGERRFQNSNVYIGQFVRDMFEGTGILINNAKKNWVCGRFAAGNLVDLVNYDNENTNEVPDAKVMQELHKKKSSWRDIQITLPDFGLFMRQITKIEKFKQSSIQVIDVDNKKQEVLKRIQYNFVYATANESVTLEKSHDNVMNTSDIPQRRLMARGINNFENIFDGSTNKVRLKPLAITPDLRREVEERELLKEIQRQQRKARLNNIFYTSRDRIKFTSSPDTLHPIKASKHEMRNNIKPISARRSPIDTSRSRKRIFGNTDESTPRNTIGSTDRQEQPAISSSKRNRIFSTNRSRQTSPLISKRDDHQQQPLKIHIHTPEELQNRETARLREEYSPIVSRRSRENSVEESKRLVTDRARIFTVADEQGDSVSFKYSPFRGGSSSKSPSSRRNRIF